MQATQKTVAETHLNVLHLEDNIQDAEWIRSLLEADNLICNIRRVTTRRDFESAINDGCYDLIISDFSLPSYDGKSAFEFASRRQPDIPFIFVSGTIGEERAVETLKMGAVDYIVKDRMPRLPSAVRRALVDVKERVVRRQFEQKIREQAALLDQAQDAIFVRDMDHRITYWNKGAARIYGWTSEEVIGQQSSHLLYKTDSPRRDDIWNTILEKGEWTGELSQVTKSGKELVVMSRRTLLRDGEGQPLAVLNINTDITERKQLEQQYLRSQRMEGIGALASGIAHDMNNVLTPILIASDILRERTKDEAVRPLVGTIRDSVERGSKLLKQILQFARGQDGDPILMTLRSLVNEMAAMVRCTFPRSVRIEIKLASDLHLVRGDVTQLHQVLLNLCVNARDAMPGGGLLTISATNVTLKDKLFPGAANPVSGDHVLLTVSDTGMGMPPEVMDKIFQPFFTTKGEGKGNGLGLSTVANIVRKHGGYIEVNSAPNCGTTFAIHLPSASTQNAAENK